MSDDLKQSIVVICGPTGVGKTSAAVEMAECFNGRIISADSMQIYRYMDIGTAKPTHEEQVRVAHHMIDIVDPDEHFDAAMFAEIAGEKISHLHNQGFVPFIAGGTGLYIKTLIHGIFPSVPVDPDIRLKLKKEASAEGIGFLYERLSKFDPGTAGKIHPNDTYRIIRALEVFETTGKTISECHHEHRFANKRFRVLKIGLNMDRELLYERINIRVDVMAEAGLADEVRNLLRMGYLPELKSMQSIGYRHINGYISGELSWEETIRTLKQDTRRYAKRQMTWFKADSEIVWTEAGEYGKVKEMINSFL
ncbi:MAG: tRNA (adenosine(37)-N6)-dimethylallyltransferase MiaA [Desulfobacterales bacterium]|nr:tRNA (adenosine(37)-N6)-dimethylallyltransferase MiaA [Desulfobacterales bacterium]